MTWRVRRVVTGHDAQGRSMVLMDSLAPNVKEIPSMPGLAITDLWETTEAPARNEGSADSADRLVRLEPPRNGTILRIVEFPPDAHWRNRTDAREAFDAIQATHAPDRSSSDPMMHKTLTVDYIVVLKGEIHAILDRGETLLRAGDVLVQRGTNHSWSVRGSEPCVIAAVLVSAAPVGTKPRGAGAAAKSRPRVVAGGRPARKTASRSARKRA